MAEAARITQMLDLALGADRFDRGPVPIEQLVVEYSTNTYPEERVEYVTGAPIDGCVGALVRGEDSPPKWAVLYHQDQSEGRKAYTVAHEMAHWVLHRHMLSDSIYCGVDDVFRGGGIDIEREADVFAANLLMPFNDFRANLPARERPGFDSLGKMASRYGVSLTAAILRWLEYTEVRALVVVSTDGYANWSKPSKPALRTGAFIRTRSDPFELPSDSIAARAEFNEETRAGIEQPPGTWFGEQVVEMAIRSDRYDREITILHLDDRGPVYQEEELVEDSFDQFFRFGEDRRR
ncbi:MAG: ImmA/IrrE family metallo-endopeptidase [Devosia indica]